MTPKSETLKAYRELYLALCQARAACEAEPLARFRDGVELLIREAGAEIERLDGGSGRKR